MERWFYTGLFMEDGITPISVCAKSETQAREFEKRGWRPVEETGVSGRASDGKRKAGNRARSREDI